ncbi:MAG: hypothetical protein G3M70_12025 [Candidatus Nitronauta litoralis]|uniref:SxtJ n=1 Tax=Candidatus Nitronauta litoralis TaxID=2705533 RepID=A0A7T0BX59_9BACT|nr:MAG: hypothetical protein G3M70_12025 [Candidatus Nitronauta litoralis]
MTAHETLDNQHQIKTSTDRSFGFWFSGIFLAIALFIWYKSGDLKTWLLVLSAVFGLSGAVYPSVLAPLNKLWTKLGLLMGKIVSPIVMGIIFFVVVTPMGLFMRLTGKDLLRLKFQPEANSYWIPRDPPGPDPETLSNQF